MYTSSFVCFSCGIPVGHAQSRFNSIINGDTTEEERFAVLGLEDKYERYIKLRKTKKEKDSFEKVASGPDGDNVTFKQWKETRGLKIPAEQAYEILGIHSLCCQRSVLCPSVWANYNPHIPPGSGIKLDQGDVVRFVKRVKMNYEKTEVLKTTNLTEEESEEYVDEERVSEEELRNIPV